MITKSYYQNKQPDNLMIQMIIHMFDHLQQNVMSEWFYSIDIVIVNKLFIVDELLIDTNTYRNGIVNKSVMQL